MRNNSFWALPKLAQPPISLPKPAHLAKLAQTSPTPISGTWPSSLNVKGTLCANYSIKYDNRNGIVIVKMLLTTKLPQIYKHYDFRIKIDLF